jgi:hypothetical protein
MPPSPGPPASSCQNHRRHGTRTQPRRSRLSFGQTRDHALYRSSSLTRMPPTNGARHLP